MSVEATSTPGANPIEIGLVIDGGERPSERRLEVRNPARRSELVGTVPDATTAEVNAAIEAARIAQPAWGATSVAERVALFERIADELDAHADEIAALEARENGSALFIAQREMLGTAGMWREAGAYLAAALATKEHESERGFVRITRKPFGVVGCIVPWNAPLILTVNKIVPAIAAGNAVILKPSPLSPLASSRVAQIAAAILPPGVLNVVNGGGEAGAAIVAHRDIRKLSFTGGGETARHIMRQAADTLTGVHFELGGNDPAIVLDDADLAVVAAGIAESAFRRSGQVCFAVKRVYVPRARCREFGELLAEQVDRLVIGDPLDEHVTMGPMNNAAQLEHVQGLLSRLDGTGRDVRVLGHPFTDEGWEDGYFVRPAVVLDAEQEDEIVAVEQFGPILPVVAYDDIEQALAWANDSEFGLCSSVWSSDRRRALEVADRIESGMTIINSHLFSRAGSREIPFGGWKQSGIGWEASPYGIDEYLQFHSIDVQGER